MRRKALQDISMVYVKSLQTPGTLKETNAECGPPPHLRLGDVVLKVAHEKPLHCGIFVACGGMTLEHRSYS